MSNLGENPPTEPSVEVDVNVETEEQQEKYDGGEIPRSEPQSEQPEQSEN
jgi:hypothetical protein